MLNKDRNIVRIIKEICSEKDINLSSFSFDWIFRLERNGEFSYIFGYNFGINSSTSSALCNDKSAMSDILEFSNVPHVEHYFFMSPTNLKYVGADGNWNKLIHLLDKYKIIVCKSNEGSGGHSVYLAENQFQLEEATYKIFKSSRSMAVCPYYEIKDEYRVIVVNDNVKLIYSKKRPFIIGDGKRRIIDLLPIYMNENECIIGSNLDREVLNTVLNQNQIFYLNWKHNLGQGATPELLVEGPLRKQLSIVALYAARMLKIKFASVDIIIADEGLKVLEINSGVMMEEFSSFSESNYKKAKEIYSEVIDLLV